jgi:hypothetical protein
VRFMKGGYLWAFLTKFPKTSLVNRAIRKLRILIVQTDPSVLPKTQRVQVLTEFPNLELGVRTTRGTKHPGPNTVGPPDIAKTGRMCAE